MPDTVPDYERLGRYHAAAEAAQAAVRRRNAALATLGDLITVATARGADLGRPFDTGRAAALLAEAAEAEDTLAASVALANAHAPACGKPLLRFR